MPTWLIILQCRTYICPLVSHYQSFIMDSQVLFSRNVINTLRSLPENDRGPIANALAAEFILGRDPLEGLSALQSRVYCVLRFYVCRDQRNLLG